MAKANRGPRLVTIDIETAPLESFTWGIWDQTVGLDQIKTDWSILSFSAKVLGKPKVIYADTGGRGADKVRDDGELLKKLWTVLDEADIVVAQNGKSFDLRRINARLLQKGFPPYSPIRVIDTMLAAKRHFGFTSNKLAWLSDKLTATKKLTHKKYPGFSLWLECLKDNKKAWAEMKRYNVADTVATEQLYLKLRPWIDGHANVSVYGELELACPKCGSKKLQRRGKAVTQSGVYSRLQCQDCGGWARSRKVEKRVQSLVN